MTADTFAVRGVIEGFYGPPWTHSQRLDMIAFLARHGFTTFVYAPKDDPLVRRDWPHPYSGDQLERLTELVAACRDHGLDFTYCLSPGLTVRYSGGADAERVHAKFSSVAALGVRSFGLLLDDIPARLQHPEDRAAFPDLIAGQSALIGEVARLLDLESGERELIVCPTEYFGRGDEDTLVRLAAAIDPRIHLFWTGRVICSPTLDVEDARRFAASTGRPPTYWDNYPVNDVAMTHELHIGPYRGREPGLAGAARGIVVNPMQYPEASKIALATIGDYLVDPAGYDPERSWSAAIGEVAGADADAFALFADTVRSSCLAFDDAPLVARALEELEFARAFGGGEAEARNLGELAARLEAAADRLLDEPVENPALIAEARPWIQTFRIGAGALRTIARLAAEGRLEADGPTALAPARDALRASGRRVFGDLLDMTLSEIVDPLIPHSSPP